MGSEIVFLFTPICVAAIGLLLYFAAKRATRTIAISVLVLSAAFSAFSVSVVANWSFWTQAGFYSFAFLAANVVLVPLGLAARWLAKRKASSS
jgi:hypothetical protein